MERLVVMVYGDGVPVITTVEYESKQHFIDALDAEYERVSEELNEFIPMPSSIISVHTIQRSFAFNGMVSYQDYHHFKNGAYIPCSMHIYTMDEFFSYFQDGGRVFPDPHQLYPVRKQATAAY